ncbi:MAG: hypothetical protein WCT03_27815, partial [Candidatus Obscuribacterales bacterium]
TLVLKSTHSQFVEDFSSSGKESNFERNSKQLPVSDWESALKALPSLERLTTNRPNGSKESIQEFLRQIPAARVNDWATQFGYSPSVR